MPKMTRAMKRELQNQFKNMNMEDLGEYEELMNNPELLEQLVGKKGQFEKKIDVMLSKQKRKYKKSIQDYLKDIKRKEHNHHDRSRAAKYFNEVSKAKTMDIYQRKIQEELQNEELSMHYKLRDEQANYIRFM